MYPARIAAVYCRRFFTWDSSMRAVRTEAEPDAYPDTAMLIVLQWPSNYERYAG